MIALGLLVGAVGVVPNLWSEWFVDAEEREVVQ